MAIRQRRAYKRPFEQLDNPKSYPFSENHNLFFERVGITNNGHKEKKGMRGLQRKIDKIGIFGLCYGFCLGEGQGLWDLKGKYKKSVYEGGRWGASSVFAPSLVTSKSISLSSYSRKFFPGLVYLLRVYWKKLGECAKKSIVFSETGKKQTFKVSELVYRSLPEST